MLAGVALHPVLGYPVIVYEVHGDDTHDENHVMIDLEFGTAPSWVHHERAVLHAAGTTQCISLHLWGVVTNTVSQLCLKGRALKPTH